MRPQAPQSKLAAFRDRMFGGGGGAVGMGSTGASLGMEGAGILGTGLQTLGGIGMMNATGMAQEAISMEQAKWNIQNSIDRAIVDVSKG